MIDPSRMSRVELEALVRQAIGKAVDQVEPSPIDRRLAQTEEGRVQRVLILAIGIGAALAFGLTWLGADPYPAYSLMGAASAALLGNAWLGGKRQEAKADVEVAKVEAEAPDGR